MANMTSNSVRFLCPTGPVQDGDRFFQGVNTGLQRSVHEINDWP